MVILIVMFYLCMVIRVSNFDIVTTIVFIPPEHNRDICENMKSFWSEEPRIIFYY